MTSNLSKYSQRAIDIRLEDENPLIFLQMNEMQTRFVRIKNKEGYTPKRRLGESGNKAGKTHLGLAEDLAHAWGFRPWLEEGDPDYKVNIKIPNMGLIGCETLSQSVMQKIWPTLRELIPKTCAYKTKKNPQGQIQRISFKTDPLNKKCESEMFIRCFSDDTEVLTDSGWKLFQDLNQTERIMTVSMKTGGLELQKPLAYFSYLYRGPMIHGKSQNLDYLVTPTHNMLVCNYHGRGYNDKFTLKPAICLGRRDATPRVFSWVGDDVKNYTLPWNKSVSLPMKDWVAFLGCFLSEGHAAKTEVAISQYPGKSKDEIRKVLDRFPIKFSEKEKTFRAYNTKFARYMRRTYGLSGDKYIPIEIKQLSKELLEVLVYYLVLGDGAIYNAKRGKYRWTQVNYTSKSKRLIDDLQEVLLKIGLNGFVFRPSGSNFYRLNFLKSEKLSLVYNDKSKEEFLKEINYNGRVYCVETPNHTLITRRNGRTLASGNSYDQEADSYEGIDYDWIHWDEPPPKKILQAAERGKVVTNAPSWFTMTPLKEAYIYDEYSLRAYNNGGNDDEIAVIRGEIWDNCIDWCSRCKIDIPRNRDINHETQKLLRPITNCPQCSRIMGFITKAGIDEYLKTLDPEEREAREKGLWKHLSGLVYKMLDRDIHVYEDFPIPRNWMKIEGIDPHDAAPTCYLFGAVSPEEIEVLGKVRNRIFFFDYLLLKEDIDTIIRKIKGKREHHGYSKPKWVILDAKYGVRTEMEGRTWEDELTKRGLGYIKLSSSRPGDVELGHKLVREYLKPHHSTIQGTSRPGMLFAKEGCHGEGGPIHHMFNYQYKPDKDDPDKSFKDFPDICRYVALDQPVYKGPEHDRNVVDMLQKRREAVTKARRRGVM